jgi:hypothetical protein
MIERFIPTLRDLDPDLREVFMQKLRVRWTHTSTALEGNTLNEGETLGLLQYGLTIAGKPLAHHNEVLGHSRAIELLYRLIDEFRPLTEADLHALHTAIQTSVEVDYLKPVGAWKREPNSTLAKQGGRTVINDTTLRPRRCQHSCSNGSMVSPRAEAIPQYLHWTQMSGVTPLWFASTPMRMGMAASPGWSPTCQ